MQHRSNKEGSETSKDKAIQYTDKYIYRTYIGKTTLNRHNGNRIAGSIRDKVVHTAYCFRPANMSEYNVHTKIQNMLGFHYLR